MIDPMVTLILGLVIGFIMCIPIGPINVWVINTEIKKGFGPAFSIALGGSLMDFIYFLVIMSGFSMITFSPTLKISLKILGVVFLFAFGLKELLSKPKVMDLQQIPTKGHKNRNYFILGLVIYLSNPTLVATLSGIVATLKSYQLFADTTMNHFYFSLGAAAGSAGWFFFLLKILKKYKHKITGNFLTAVNRVCGSLILFFSCSMGLTLFRELSQNPHSLPWR